MVGGVINLILSVLGPLTDPDAPFRVVALERHSLTEDLYAAVQQRQARDSPSAGSTLAIFDPTLGTIVIIGAVDGTAVILDGIAFVNVPKPVTGALLATDLT